MAQLYPGIDLGTTNSMIAHVNAYGQPALFPDSHNASLFRTPSIIHIGHEGCLVGTPAETLLDENGALPVVRFVKSLLGQLEHRFFDHLGRGWSPEALSALLIRKLIADATSFTGDDVLRALIAVPAQFGDDQRRATLLAAELAGLQEATLVDEPVAAAVFYGMQEGASDRTLLVYDFGGGTFDVTILQVAPTGLYAIATDGHAELGGRTIDEELMALIDQDLARLGGLGPLSDVTATQRLRRFVEDAKIKLGQRSLPQVSQAMMLFGQLQELMLTRARYENVVSKAVDQTLEIAERCLAEAGLDWNDIDKILLTGGSSMLPLVTNRLAARSGKSGHDIVTKFPHQAVAFGAAIIASRRDQGAAKDDFVLSQISGSDLCLRIWDAGRGVAGREVLIARNTPLPATYSRIFYTAREDQTRIALEIVQLRGDPAEESKLGHFIFGPIMAPARNYPVEVTVSCTREGLVEVTASDRQSGQTMSRILREDQQRGSDYLTQQALVVSVARIS